MANELSHKDAGVELTQTEDNATDRHYCANQAAEDMFRADDATGYSGASFGATGSGVGRARAV